MLRFVSISCSTLALVGSTASCGKGHRVTPVRADLNQVLVTNSITAEDPPLPVDNDGSLELTYSFMAQNTGDDLMLAALTEASAEAGKHPVAVACRARGQDAGDLELLPGKRFRVDCSCRIEGAPFSALAHSDLLLSIRVPFSSPSGEGSVEFPYHLYRGDHE